ncbi:putative UPF0481 protein [Salvia divinorum]|uniref:UPF0481 protein n=1 Tax=Salvia divinorum TaxID=28513 RepID=A0ABD1HE55_SALDI
MENYINGGGSRREDFEVAVDIATLQGFSKLLQFQPKKLYSESCHRRQIQKIPPQIRRRNMRRSQQVDDKKKAFFYSKIVEEAAAIRDSYAEAKIMEKYNDKSFALMMLLDSSIIIDFIHNYLGMQGNSFSDWQCCHGAGSGPLMVRDVMLMENQTPLQVLQLLITLQYGEGEAALFRPCFFSTFLSYNV